MYVCAPRRTEEGVRSPGTGVKAVVSQHLGTRIELGSFGRSVLLIAELFLYSIKYVLK